VDGLLIGCCVLYSKQSVSKADFLIEAVSEDEVIKSSVLREADRIVSPEAIFATNTSSISITRLAAVTKRPSQVVGMHFMNPVPIMPLIELVRGMATSNATFAETLNLARILGRETIVSQDRPGFIVNRLLMPMINEAFYTMMEGVATAEDIDAGMRLGTSHPMGPLKLADFIGLDTCLSIMRVLHQELGDDKYRPCPVLTQYVDAGWLGKKTGRGVYSYEDKL
jgi:3-hydroxybutyryl-CoA dehydrogenase